MSDQLQDDTLEGVAIIGLAGRFPKAGSVEEFWENLKGGVEGITFFTDEELLADGVERATFERPDYVRAKGVLSDIDLFDAAFFGCSAGEAETMDPQHRTFLECAWEALENAGYDPERYSGAIGLFAGTGINTYLMLNLLTNPDLIDLIGVLQASIRNRTDHLTTRVAYKLNLRGPAVTVQTTCSTGLVAVHLACQNLLNYQCDMALAGAVAIGVPNRAGYTHQEGGIFSVDGHCRPFDASATGTVSGNGLGLVVLKRLADALADGDRIHAVVKGSAINNDGSVKIGYTAPSVGGQARVIALAQAVANVEPETICYVEAHGTGTTLGDPVEVAALTKVFSDSTKQKNFCALGSVKSNIGHLDVAAGIAGLIKTTLALEHQLIPPSLHYREPNPQVDFAGSPFYVADRLIEWKPSAAHPRRAGISSFGIGGTNAHVVLEEAPPDGGAGSSRSRQLLLLSARTPSALEAATARLAVYLKHNPGVALSDVAHTLQVGRREFEHRRMLVCRDAADAVAALETLDPRRVVPGLQEPKERPVVFMFPGQGAQYVGMGRGLYEGEADFRRHLDECCELLRPHLGFDLRELLFATGDDAAADERLKQTEVAQPALFAIEYALAMQWKEWGVRPQAMIGHSLGEYVAACLAGVFSLADALKLVAARGRLMQAAPRGAMISVPKAEKDVLPLLTGRLAVAAVNAPGMCVVAGPHEEVEALSERLAGEGVVCRPLHTSHAFHSPLMEGTLAPFAAVLSGVRLHAPQLPLISNLTGTWMTAQQATSPDYWVSHLCRTVRFGDGVAELFKEPQAVFLEVGPGRTLMSLARWHPQKAAGQTVLTSLPHPEEQATDLEQMLNALGRLWLSGARVDWDGFYAGERRRRVPLPTYPFERRRYWVEPGKNLLGEGTAKGSLKKKTDVTDWFYVPSWKRSVLSNGHAAPVAGEAEAPCYLVFADACGVGARLAARLAARGRGAVTVTPGERFEQTATDAFTIAPGRKADFDELLKALAAVGRTPTHLLHLWNVTPEESGAGSEELQRLGFYSLITLAQSLGEAGLTEQPLRLDVVTNGMQSVVGGERLCPVKATVLGPVKVIPQEYRNVRSRSIDISAPSAGDARAAEAAADLLQAEVLSTHGEAVVAHRGGRRWVQSFEPVRLAPLNGDGGVRLREGGVYLITGGMGGIGLEVASYLARVARARLVLVGRSELPAREGWDELLRTGGDGETLRRIRKVRELEEAGAEVLALACDVTDREGMRGVVELARARFGPLNGVVHAAGVPGGGMIQLKTHEKAAEVIDPKVMGAEVLGELLIDEGLDFFVLCSSRSAILGGFGQVDYCAANAFLDAFAFDFAARAGAPAVSINWDGWQEVGMLVKTAARYGGARGTPELNFTETNHPLLERFAAESESKETYVTDFNVARKWILEEHRIGGNAVLPGVTYLEMARAAFERHADGGPIELQDVFFLTPMGVRDGETRVVRFTLEREADGYRFLAASRAVGDEGPDARWTEHAMGFVKRAQREEPARHDLEELKHRCGLRLIHGDEEEVDPDLGPRWQNIQKVHLGDGELLVLFELAEEFAADLDTLQLHPSLLDRAAGTGMSYLERDGIYLPLSYKRLVFRAPLPRRIYAHIRNVPNGDASKETISFNVRVMDEHGVELVRIDEFSEKRINDLTGQVKALLHDAPNGAGARTETAAQGLYHESLKEGIAPAEGVDAFARVLAHYPLPQVVVSTKDLQASIRRANEFTPLAAADGAHAQTPSRTTRQPRRLESEYIAPRDEAERMLAGILEELLGVEAVGVHDNFFELGGDSVLSIQVIARAKQSGIQITPQQIFRHQTVAELAAVAVREGDGSGQLERIDRGGELPLSFAQHRLWFMDQIEEQKNASYSIPEALRLTGDLSVTVLRDALSEIMRRHEVLRSRFDNRGGTPVLDFRPPAPLFLPVVDLSHLSEAEREREARRLAQAEAACPFDLTGDPLLRVVLLWLGAREHVGLFTIHHIASDAWSLGVLVRELAVLYDAFRRGAPSPLPELPVQYVDYAAWQRRLMSGPTLDAQLSYWKRQLGGRLPVLDLPTDHPHTSVKGWSGARLRHKLPDELTERVRALSQREGVTPFMTLLAVFDVMLWRLSGQTDVLVGASVAGRNRPEADDLIGLFINSLVLRIDLSDRPRFGDLLGRVRDVTLGALAHQDVPFDRVVEELRPERVPGRTPIFQVVFGLRQVPGEEVRMPGVEMTPEDFGVGDVRYDLALWIEESERGLTAIWNYRTGLLTTERIESWSQSYLRLLERALDDPQARVDRLGTETADELRRRQESERDWEQSAAEQLLTRRRRSVNVTNL